ncbi:O-antigen ligase family protein [Vibrio sp. 10N.237.312.B06]|uniref:O-antigen ligase family protein n=1 Tax=Vibrio sp. 10N.237.312.B06 TaxID=3229974 RepID=UPI00354DD289
MILNFSFGRAALYSYLMVFPFGVISILSKNFNIIFTSLKSIQVIGFIASSILCIIYFISRLRVAVRFNLLSLINGFIIISILLWFLLSILVTFELIGYGSSNESISSFEYHFPILIKYLSLIFISANFHYILKDEYKKWHFVLWVLASFSIVISSNMSILSLDFLNSRNPSDRSFTLTLSDYFALTSLLLLYFVNGINKYVVFLISAVLLFFISSRTALYTFVVAFLIKEVLGSGFNLKNIILLFLFCFIFYVVGIFAYDNVSGYSLRIFTGFSGDSFDERNDIMRYSWERIMQSPIIGDFAGQLDASFHGSNKWGVYSHNILSFWRQYGFIGLALIIYSMLFTFFNVVNIIMGKTRCMNLLPVLLYLTCVIIFSRSYVYPWIFMLLGMNLFILKRASENGKD